MKSLLHLWKMLAIDFGERCSVDTARDYKTVSSRVEHEGMEFLSITLPTYGKAFERWLELGSVEPSSLPNFKKRGDLPVFLQGFLLQVFNSDGVIRGDASPDAVLAIRQLTGVFGKMFLPASAVRERNAKLAYLEVDDELEQTERNLASEPAMVLALRRIFAVVFGGILDQCDSDIAYGQVVPKHGPGGTADRLFGNKKFEMHWTDRLEEFFKSDEFLIPNHRYLDVLGNVEFKPRNKELPVRVTAVPKTQKTPRLIAMEPTCMQYAQQAISSLLTKRIEDDNVLQRIVRFSDQEPNQVLARRGSLDGTLATLDLSEASDRVSNLLVKELFKPWPYLHGSIQACRSEKSEVAFDKSSVITRDLVKFASMGSALTFPVEAMVFTTVIFYGIEQTLGRRLRRRDIDSFCGRVAVYGDDIIVPIHYVSGVTHALESFGFKVNSNKSFWTGMFRESCGKDYFNGVDVSYVKFRKGYPSDTRDVLEVVSLVSFFNQVKHNHYTHTTNWLRKELVKLLGFFPKVSRDSEILGEWDDIEHDISRLCAKTHRPLTKGWLIRVHIPQNPLDGERALLKFFLKQGDKPLSREHLVRSGRSSGVSIILREAAV